MSYLTAWAILSPILIVMAYWLGHLNGWETGWSKHKEIWRWKIGG